MDKELFKLCKAVYIMTGWSDTDSYFLGEEIIHRTPRQSDLHPPTLTEDDCSPRYTSDYLLEKLPKRIEGNVLGVGYAIYEPPSAIDIHHAWLASYEDRQGIPHFTLILTPLSKLS